MSRKSPGVHRLVDAGARLLASVLLASLVIAAWHDASKAWDVWFYHLPFGARLTGIVDGATYTFGRSNQARFDGFPLAGELLQGLLWRITGRPECANFVSLAAVPGLAWFLAKHFRVRWHLTALAILAIPLVQIHATACYVDLPANAAAAMLLLLGFRAVVLRTPPSARVLAGAAALAAFTANTKFQLVPIVLAGALILVVVSLRRDEDRTGRMFVIALALPLVMFTPLKNLAVHGNPVWPVELSVMGRSFPHQETAYASSPDWLEQRSKPIKFFASIFEVANRPIASHARWSLDQWTPPREEGYRLGGFFGAYVGVNLLALVLAAALRKTREARVALAFVFGATVVTSVMPQSHELRYYLVWMLLLVALNLVVWTTPALRIEGDEDDDEQAVDPFRERSLVAVVVTGALGVVAWSTQGHYLYASGTPFRDLLASRVDVVALAKVPPGSRVCIDRQPWTFLYAPRFHPMQRYTVQEAENPAECEGAPTLDELAAGAATPAVTAP